MKSLYRSLSSLFGTLLAIAITVACFRNVFWDDVRQQAAQVACGGRPGCGAQLTELMHTPIGHAYRFLVAGKQVEIDCRREYLLEGEYTCRDKASDPLNALMRGSASASASVAPPPPSSPKGAPRAQK